MNPGRTVALAVLVAAGLVGPPYARAEPILPLPQSISLDSRKVTLGEKLFSDPRLSRTGTMACANCHPLDRGGADGLPRSITNDGSPDATNAPTVFNTGFNFRHTWRGEFRTLEEQADADLRNPRHANTSWDELLPKLQADPEYRRRFTEVYGSVSRESVLNALATFERSLITPNSRFDRYLRGERGALSDLESRGYRLFKGYGCVACHQGMNVGGNLFEKFGVVAPYFRDQSRVSKADLGRFNVTGKAGDEHVFKVPSLRNVAVTAPYFHDGSVKDLGAAVRIMGEVQLGVEIPASDVHAIVAFLRTLTGEYRGRGLDAPARTAQ